MAYLKTVTEDKAESLVHDQYQAALKNTGYVPNYVKAFSLRPEVYDAWSKLIGGIRSLLRNRTVTVKLNLTGLEWKPVFGLPAHETYQTQPNTVAA